MSYSFVQSVEGTRVTSGASISATFSNNVGAGNLLVAVILRSNPATYGPGTIGQVSDNAGNYWKQAVEYEGSVPGGIFGGDIGGPYGSDIWICESATGGNKPEVTATLMFFSGITGMNILLLEYTGNSGVELIDQIGQASVTTTSVSVTTNYNLVGSGDLALSVVTGNCSAATVPSGWTSRLSDTTQKAWVAEYVGPTQGASATAAWTGLTGATEGSSIIVCIKQTGAPIGSPTLLQMSYQVWSNPFSPFAVSPVVGNTLVITGEAGSEGFQSVSGVAGDVWRKGGSTGQDLVTGVNNATFVCSPTVGGGGSAYEVTVGPGAGGLLVSMEFSGLNYPLVVDSWGAVLGGSSDDNFTVSTQGAISAGDLAIASMACFTNVANHPAAGWTQCQSDTNAAGWVCFYLNTPSGILTSTWSGGPFKGFDGLIAAFRAAQGTSL